MFPLVYLSHQPEVDATNIPKGTYVRLRPLEAGYNPDDWKSLLERHLREHYTCLTKNSILSVNGVKGETFKFLVDRLSPEGDGICVVDTDLEVDIEALNEEQARETMRQIMTKAQTEVVGGVSKGDLDIWKDVSGHVSPGGYVHYILPSWDRSQPLTITLSGIEQEDGVDLFVTPKSSRQRVLPRDSAHVFGDFSPAEDGVKSITMSPTNVEMEGAEAILVSVHGFSSENQRTSQPIPFTVRAKVGSPTSKAGQDRMEVDGEEHSSDEEQCSNCKQWVPSVQWLYTRTFAGGTTSRALTALPSSKKTQTSGIRTGIANTTRPRATRLPANQSTT